MTRRQPGHPVPTLAEQVRRLKFRVADGRCLPKLILMIDSARLPDPEAAIRALPSGSAVILRDYELPGRGAHSASLLVLCRRLGHRLLIGGDGRLAAGIGADGLHLPEALAHTALRWRRQRPGWLITAAAHSLAALLGAGGGGIDAVLLAPVFATASHPGRRTLGPVRFAALVRRSPVPVYALGGIDGRNAPRLRHSGAAGIAAISGLIPAKKR